MKLKALFAALFVAGLAASIAFASPSSDGGGTTTTATASTSTSDKHGDHGKKDKRKDGDDEKGDHKGDKPKCRNVELKGTVAGGSLSVAVTKANKAGRDLVGSSASLSFAGKVSVKARLCAAATGSAASTLQLRVLKVEEHPAPATTGTTTTTTTTTTTP